MGSKLDTKQMEVLSFNIWAGGAGEKWRRRGEQRSAASGGHPSKATTWRGRHHLNLPHHQVGTHPKQQLGGVVIISIFLITSKQPARRYPCPVVSKHQGDKRVSRRSSGATEARRGSLGDFSLSLESESGSNVVLIAVLVVFLSVLEEGSRPQVLHNKCFKISSSL